MKQENLISLKANQIHLDELKEIYQKKFDFFTTKNAALLSSIEVVSSKQEEIKEEVRTEAIEEFDKTGKKKLLGGIGIRILSKLIYRESEAVKWAEENMPVAIKEVLDKKQFENYAKSSDLDFVDKEEKVSVTFPKEITI